MFRKKQVKQEEANENKTEQENISPEDSVSELSENDQKTDTSDENADAPCTAEEKIAELEIQIAELNDKNLRLYSEFDNYRKRTTRERIELYKNASEDVITEMLRVLDDFDRAMKASEEFDNPDALKEGMNLIYSKFKNVLAQRGLKEMDCIEMEFDTDFHEALTKVETEDESEKGKVVDVIEKGYLLNGKVIRFAKVVVAS
ncbi:MAG: nucleotide exchange factor GrpE [Bacteroidota bacterium]